jgi:Flp pilus assembly protein TadG
MYICVITPTIRWRRACVPSAPRGSFGKRGNRLPSKRGIKWRRRSGAAVVEFAVVAPVFFLFVFGLIEYGRMVMVQQILTNAAREGARVGILDNTTQADVDTAVNTYLTAGNINGATTTVTPNPPSSAASGAPVTVTVSVNFNNVSWLPSPFYLGGKTLSYTATMRRETNP